MDELEIYVNVEQPSGDHSKWKREMNSPENIYENEDTRHAMKSNRIGRVLSGVAKSSTVKKSSFWAAVILGLLCLLLLAGLITLVFLYTKGSSKCEEEKVQLQASYNNLTKEKDQLQTSLAEERDKTQALQSQDKWIYFSGSFYYISSMKKSWQESRDDCKEKGADLVIINNNEEQEFIRRWKIRTWIGLTDTETGGTWKWVDGTPLTKHYWAESEPNDAHGIEDCAEIYSYDSQNSWNDSPCDTEKDWICEMPVK